MDGEELKKNLKNKYWRLNNLYYIQNKARQTVLFRLNNVQQMMWQNDTGRDVRLKARQQTTSTYYIIKFLDSCLFEDNIEARTIADAEKNLPKLFDKAKFAYDHLHPTLKKLYPLKQNTKYEMSFKRRNSHYLVCLDTHSDTVTKLHFSEVAFMENAKDKIDESTETVPMDQPNTEIIFESIANGVDNEFYDRYQSGKDSDNEYTSHFFRWFDFTDYQLPLEEDMKGAILKSLTDIERELIGKHTLSLEQIAWRRQKINSFSGSMEQKLEVFKVKYPENDIECFLTTGSHVYDQKMIDMYMNNKQYIMEHIKKCTIGMFGDIYEDRKGQFYIYKEPEPGEEYIVSGDVAKGMAKGDYSVLYVFNKRTFDIVAKFRDHVAPEVLGAYGVYVASYYNSALLAIEKNDRGHTANYKAQVLRYPHLYYMGMERGDRFSGEYGYHTNSKTKPQFIDQSKYDFKTGMFRQLPLSLLKEMRTYIETLSLSGNVKLGAMQGKKDDEVVTFSIGLILCYLFPYRFKSRKKTKPELDYTKTPQGNSNVVHSKQKVSEAQYEYRHGLL